MRLRCRKETARPFRQEIPAAREILLVIFCLTQSWLLAAPVAE